MKYWRAMKYALVLLLWGWGNSGRATEINEADRPPTIAALQSRIDFLLKDLKVPGISYTLFDRNGVIISGAAGYADTHAHRRMNEHTRLRIGSVTKTLTALLVMRAIEQGRFDLQTPVRSLYPELPIVNAFENEAPVRIVHLLEHTAGFDDMYLRAIYRDKESSDSHWSAIQQDAEALRVRWRPGSKMSYSNTGYTVLAAILEKIHQRDWAPLVQDEVLKPLQMHETVLNNSEAIKFDYSRGYSGDDMHESDFPSLWHRAAGAAWSTAHDLAELGRFLMTDGRSHPGVLRVETVQSMRRVHSSWAAQAGLQWGYGLGVFQKELAGLHLYGHNGAVDGFAANVFFNSELGIGFTEIHNSDGVMNGLARPLAGFITTQYSAAATTATADQAIPATLAQEIGGWYRLSNTRNGLMRGADWLLAVYRAEVDGDELRLQPLVGEALRFRYAGQNYWRDVELQHADTIMLRDASGHIVAFDNDGSYLERTSAGWVLLPALFLIMAVAALLTAPFGRRRVLQNRWLRRLNIAAVLTIALIVAGIASLESIKTVATVSLGPVLIFIGTTLLPLVAVYSVATALWAWRSETARVAKWRSMLGALGALTLSIYFACFDWLGLALWLR